MTLGFQGRKVKWKKQLTWHVEKEGKTSGKVKYVPNLPDSTADHSLERVLDKYKDKECEGREVQRMSVGRCTAQRRYMTE
jgi:hypothetical protein